jgi:CubicO group peptidase (beta-lactamase class C family)
MQIKEKLILLAAALFIVGSSCSRLPHTHISPSAIVEVKAELARATEAGEIEGGMILVHANGKQVLFDVQGYHDLEDRLPFKESSLLRIYSMTKPITSVAAMTLWEQGKFQLDDPVSKYISSFENVKVGIIEDQSSGFPFVLENPKREVSVRDLFSHTSGYSYGNNPDSVFTSEYTSRGVVYWYYGMFPPKMSIQKAANLLSQVPLEHEPGERWTYGLNVDILGALVEVWSGMKLKQYIDESVLKPLGMKDTFFDIPEDKLDRFTSCHIKYGGGFTVVDKWNTSPYRDGFEFHSGGGGLTSTIQDYGRFSQMLANWGTLDGVRILKKPTLEKMFKNNVPEGGGMNFGLGFSIESVTLGDISGVAVEQYTWGGYASTVFKVIPEANLSMVFMRQSIPFDSQVAERLFEMVCKGTAVAQ